MFSKQIIPKETQVLLKLLRLALGTEPRRYFGEPVVPFPDGIDWREVIRLSYKHKVSALAVDGLRSSGYDIYYGLDEQRAEELRANVERWFDDAERAEQSYDYYVEVLKTVCNLFKANGLTPIILKGYGLSVNYPMPSHRGCGDIDIFLVDENGNPAADKGDVILRELAKEHINERVAHHHTHYEFKGITIENHHELSDPTRSTKEEWLFIECLSVLASQDYTPIQGLDYVAYGPSLVFDVLFQIRHIFNHFSDGGINLRQLCDFYLFLRAHGCRVDWQRVNVCLTDGDLKGFANGLYGLINVFFGASDAVFPLFYEKNMEMENDLVYDFFHFNEHKYIGFLNVGMYYRDRWHYRFFQNKNWVRLTVGHIINKLKRF